MKQAILVSVLVPLLVATSRADEPPQVDELLQRCTAKMVGLGEDDGTPIGVGPAYKVSFGRDGAEFVPVVGDLSPHNLPVRLELLTMARGAHELVEAGGRAEPRAEPEALAVRYDRGPGVSELWELRPEGVELSFELDEVPAGQGDLLVRLRLHTELQPAQGSDGADGLELLRPVAPGAPPLGVRIGLVEGRDADGRRVAGGLRLAGDVLELSLPDAFLRQARGPIVLDPLLGPIVTYGDKTKVQYTVKAAFESNSSSWLLAWTRNTSDDDQDVLGVRVSAAGAPLGNLLVLAASTATDAQYPDVAAIRLRQRWLVAWDEGDGTRGRTVATNGSLGTATQLAAHATGGPELAGNATLVNDRGLMIFYDTAAQGLSLASVRVPPSGIPVADPPVLLATDSMYTADLPATGGATNTFLAVWITPAGVRGRMVDSTAATIIGSTTLFADTASLKTTDVGVDGDGSRWAVVAMRSSSPTSDGNPNVRRVEYNGPFFALGPTLMISGKEWYRPCVAWNGSTFQLTALSLDYSQPAVVGLYMGGIAPIAFQFTDPFALVGPEQSIDGVKLASPASATTQPAATGLAYWALPADGIVWQTVKSHGAGGSVVDLGGGCGTGGGKLLAIGTPALANPDFQIVLLGGSLAVSTAYLNLNFPGTATSCGACSYLPIGTWVALPESGGMASVKLPLPAEPVWDGFTVEAQFIQLLPGSSPCPSLPGTIFSNRVRITLH